MPKKPKPTPGLIDRIMASKCSDSAKVIKLFGVTQIYYRAPLGDAAWDKMRELIGHEACSALAFIAGWQAGVGSVPALQRNKRLLELVPEMKG